MNNDILTHHNKSCFIRQGDIESVMAFINQHGYAFPELRVS